VKSRNQSVFIYLLLGVAIVAMIYFNIRKEPTDQGPLTINEVASLVEAGEVRRIEVNEDNSLLIITTGESGKDIEQISQKEPETTLVSQLLALGVSPSKLSSDALVIEAKPPSPWAGLLTLASYLLPVIFLGVMFWFIFRQAQGSNNAAMAFGKSKARMLSGEHPTVTFADVAGVDESKEELREIVEFLKEPQKFIQL
jgi:cell division protease FtsH